MINFLESWFKKNNLHIEEILHSENSSAEIKELLQLYKNTIEEEKGDQ